MNLWHRDDEITVEELKRRLDEGDRLVVLDVREPAEYALCNIGGTLIPLGSLPLRLNELNPAHEFVVLCHHGNRSRAAVDYLKKHGFQTVKNVTGGIEAWAQRIDRTMRRY